MIFTSRGLRKAGPRMGIETLLSSIEQWQKGEEEIPLYLLKMNKI
jgi:hypothetical protein